MLGPERFRFLNEERQLRWPEGWNDSAAHQLWIYNLHYFEDLTAHDAAARAQWHRALIERWIRENPPFAGKGWDPYPLSLRIANWIKWFLAGNEPSDAMLDNLALSARYLLRRIEYHLLGNHLLANAKALVFAGLFFSGGEADRWLQTGCRLLERELPEQILADGGHFELSPMYHSIILEDLLDLLNLARRYPSVGHRRWRAVVDELVPRIGGMRRWLVTMCFPDGQIALFNDAAWGIAPRPDELDGYATRLGLPPVDGTTDGLTHLAASGYVRLQRGEAVVIADVGEIGPDYQPGHGHADVLTFEFALGRDRLVVNSGTSVYYGNDRQRHIERSTAAHNTVEIDGENSSEMWSNFRVARRARPCHLSVKDEGDAGLLVRCQHDGYERLPGRVRHTRTWRLRDGTLDIVDELSGNWQAATARFHLHPAVAVEVDRHGSSFPSAHAQQAVLLQLGSREVKFASGDGEVLDEPSHFHPEFGVSQPNRCVRVELTGAAANFRFAW